MGSILIETIHVPSDIPITISVALSFLKRFYPAVDFFDYSIVPKCGITCYPGPGNSAYDCSFPDFHVLHPLQFHCVKMMVIHSLTPFAGTTLDWFKAYYWIPIRLLYKSPRTLHVMLLIFIKWTNLIQTINNHASF